MVYQIKNNFGDHLIQREISSNSQAHNGSIKD